MKKSQIYPTHVYWDERDQGFIALALDLPGCSAFGDTKAKALKELEHAIEGWIETAVASNEPIPEPSPLPKPSNYSGKILLRIATSLHERLAKNAEAEGVSLNQWMVTVLSAGAVFSKRSTATPEHLGSFDRWEQSDVLRFIANSQSHSQFTHVSSSSLRELRKFDFISAVGNLGVSPHQDLCLFRGATISHHASTTEDPIINAQIPYWKSSKEQAHG